MHLLLRADSGGRLGIGHVVRCLALAQVAQPRGHRVSWCGRLDGVEWLRTDVGGPGLPEPDGVLPGEDDPASLVALAAAVGADVVHLDHYHPGLAGLRGALNARGIALCNVEDSDFGRRPADVVIDPNLGTETLVRPDDGSPTLLRGLRYALLRGAVRQARELRAGSPAPCGTGDAARVLVVMGGTDAAGLLDPVLAALRTSLRTSLRTRLRAGTGRTGGGSVEVDVIVPAGRALSDVNGDSGLIRPSPPRADLPRLMAQAQLVVSAAGHTVWELCAVGAPMALVCAAENQADGYHAILAAGAAAGLGGPSELADVAATAATLRTLLDDSRGRAELGRRAAELVDGRGADRVLATLERLVGAPPSSPSAASSPPSVSSPPLPAALRARPACRDDAELLLAWRNDEVTRRWSRSRESIEWDEHLSWLESRLGSPDRLLLVVEDDHAIPVGTVRCERQPDASWVVSITLVPQQRGRGLAGQVLRCAEQALLTTHGPVNRGPAGRGSPDSEPPVGPLLRAEVHRDNLVSHRLFTGAGYTPAGPPDSAGFVTYHKQLTIPTPRAAATPAPRNTAPRNTGE